MTKNPKKILMPDDCLGRHELLDRTCMLADNVEEYLFEHPHLKKDEKAVARMAMEALWGLYQLIGANTAGDDGFMEPPKKVVKGKRNGR